MFVEGDDVAVENLTIDNAPDRWGRPWRFASTATASIVRNSRLLGWQDTLLVNRGRHYH